MSQTLLLISGYFLAALVGLIVVWRTSKKVVKAIDDNDVPLAPKPEFLRVAGRLISKDEWSDEVLEKVKKDYFFRPSAGKQFMFLQDVTMTCPKGEPTTHRVGIVCKSADLARSLAERMPKTRAEANCDTCGKKAHTSARSIVWEGEFNSWDGAL